ncbi:putative long-chain-alcohol O-fatty-acyltransferase 1, partial [Mucuna pruriens]
MEGEIEMFIKVWLTTISSLCYCYYIASRIPKGFLRLLSLLPILYLFIILPLNLSSFHLGGPTTFFLVWLGTFKLLLFSFNQGPLAQSSQDIIHFICIASLPINLKHPKSQTNTTLKPPKWLLLLKVLILAMIIRAYDYRENLHPYFILVLYCCHMYLGIELVLALSAAPVRTAFGFEIEPQFNEPYLCTSLQDFWGRRWNLMVTRILRPAVYHPVYRMSTRFVGPTCAISGAVLATFLVSGLMHELIYYYLARAPPTWEVTCFFVLHGACTAAEVAAKRVMLRRGWRLHRAVSGPLAVAFLAVTGTWLFFPQLERNGVDRKAIAEYAILVDFVKSKLPLHLIPKGFLRLLSLLPILYLFIILPLKLSSPTLVGYTAFFLVQLGTFKILLFSFNQGPLALTSPNIIHFISIASLPIIPKQHPPTKQNNNTKPKWLLPLKVLIFAMIARVYDYKQNLHPHFMLVLYCFHVYLSLELVLVLIGATVRKVFGFEIEPQFNEPYLCTSLQDFWGRRWNLMVTRLLRLTVYDTVRHMSTGFVGLACATSAAMLATFLVSGLLHELMYYYVTRVPPTWEVTCFFVLHGACTAAEVVVKKVALRRGWRLHRAVSGPLVVAFLAVTARWLFFPQLLRNEMDKKSTEEYAMLVDFVKSKLPLNVFNSLG